MINRNSNKRFKKEFFYRKKKADDVDKMKKIVIVGNPNVGKSVLFNNLTKHYVTVSNYPGTTVEISKGITNIDGIEYKIIDTPGMYSFSTITEEEKVTRRILLKEKPHLVIHVVDAKNLERMLSLTLQLIEADLPVILVLNMMDESGKEGVQIDIRLLEKELDIPVVGTISTMGEGIGELKTRIIEHERNTQREGTISKRPIEYNINRTLESIESLLKHNYNISKRAIGLLLLGDDEEIKELIEKKEHQVLSQIEAIIKEEKSRHTKHIEYDIALERQNRIMGTINKVVRIEKGKLSFREKLSRIMMQPLTGFPILFFVLYWGLYKFVGEFGAGKIVGFLEEVVFKETINPFITNIFIGIVPWKAVQDIFVGEYGIITLGFRYAVAIILPIITFFFIVFSVIEDTGYLPRLAMLLDRAFKRIGLSGRAVIPMVLGFGCDTMATIVTRTLPTKRERIISTMLLALAVPCSAQLGVILALLESRIGAMFIWVGVIGLIFLFIGYLSAKILPGIPASFYMEVPPLRLPKISNVIVKTYMLVKWYFKEILPLFLLASVLIWFGKFINLFDLIVNILRKPVGLIGLPPQAAKIFLFGFFRRDYGAAGLYDLSKEGILDGVQLVVACVALTLFLPCIAQFLMNVKERGWKTGFGISIFILVFSFSIAYVLNLILTTLGVVL